MKLRAFWASTVLAVLGAAGPAAAQSSSVEAELRRCRGIADSPARIVCYDAIVLPRAAAASTQGPTAAPVPAATQSSASAASAAPPAASAPATRDFGLPERPAALLPQYIESSIEGEFDGWTAGARLRLANGQVWEIVDGSTASYRLRDPKVRISRGLFGSFFMDIEGVAQSPRVRRAQ